MEKASGIYKWMSRMTGKKGTIECEASCISLRESKPRIKGEETVQMNGRSEANI